MRIQDGALLTAASLGHRYIMDQFLPDKAIDLLDEAGVAARIETDSLPVELDELRRRILQLEIEREALKIEPDEASKKRLESLEQELASLQEENEGLTARWEREKSELDAVREIKESIDAKGTELEQAKRRGDFETASRIQYGEIGSLEERLRDAERELDERQSRGDSLVKEEVDSEQIAEVVGKWTGIPVAKLVEGEREKLVHMEDQLAARVVGQRDAVVAVSDAVRRNRAGLGETNRPIGSFLFMGPTGVGKTELCGPGGGPLRHRGRDRAHRHVRVHGAARGGPLIGAPPGYVATSRVVD